MPKAPRPYVPPGGWYGVFAHRGAPLPGERGYVEDPVLRQMEGAKYVFDRALSLYTDPDLGGWIGAFMFQMGALESSTYTGDELSEEDWESADWQPEDFADLIGAGWLNLEQTADVFAAVSQSEAVNEYVPNGIVVGMIAGILTDAIDDPAALKPRLVVISKDEASSFIAQHHSALADWNYRGVIYTIGVRVGRRLVAVATINAPTAPWKLCPANGIIELTRVASDGSTLGASSKLAARAIDLLPMSGRRGADGCLFSTYSLITEEGTTYLALADKGLRPVERTKGKTPGGSRSAGGSKMTEDKIRWEAGPAARPPNWSVLEGIGVPADKLAGPKRNFEEWAARDAKAKAAAAARAARPPQPQWQAPVPTPQLENPARTKRPSQPLTEEMVDRALARATTYPSGTMTFVGRRTLADATGAPRYVLDAFTSRWNGQREGDFGVTWVITENGHVVATGDGILRGERKTLELGHATIAKSHRRRGLYTATIRELASMFDVAIESDVSMTAGAIGAWRSAGGKLEDRQGDRVYRIEAPTLQPENPAKKKAATIPTTMYTGRTVDSTMFDLAYTGRGNDQDGPGFYFSDDPEDAYGYAFPHGVLLAVHLEPRKLLSHTAKPNLSEVTRLLRGSPCLNDVLEDWDENRTRAFSKLLASMMDQESQFAAFLSVWYDAYHRCGQDAAYLKNVVEIGYDGAISPGEWAGRLHVIMFNPAAIQGATVLRRR